MKQLEGLNEADIIFYDIETARGVEKLDSSSQLYDAWLYKTRYQNELNKKTGLEYTPEEYFDEKAALYAPFAKVVTVVVGRIKDNKISLKSYASYDEKELLEEFNKDLKTVSSKNPKVRFCSFNGVGFDTPFLEKRMIVNGIQPASLISEGHLEPWKVTQIDLAKIWKGNAFYPDSLIAVATALGLPSPKDALDGSQVSTAFYDKRLPEIVTYCLKDVETTARIYRKLSFQEDLDKDVILLNEPIEEIEIPVLQKIFMADTFTDEHKEEIRTRIREIGEVDLKLIGEMIASHYIKKADKAGIKREKQAEIDEFLKTI